MDATIITCGVSNSSPVQGTRRLLSRRFALSIVAVLAAISCPRWSPAASLLDFDLSTPEEILLAQRAIADSVAPHQAIEPVAPPPTSAVLETTPKVHRSIGKAFLLNLAIPGAGHVYAGEKRGFVHMGMEGIAWAAYLYYHDRGKSKEREYEGYADGHWDYAKWDSIDTVENPDHQSAKALIDGFRANNRQQYYEDIGKLTPYFSGWDSQDHRNFYRGIRAHSNNFLNNAHTAVAGAFVNRIVSAVDILRIMKQRSHATLGNETHIRFKVRTKPFARDNAFGFVITKRLH